MSTTTNNVHADGEEQVLALVCGETFPWDRGGDANQCHFWLNRDGAITARESQCACLAVELNWSFHHQATGGAPVKTGRNSWKLGIQMTFTTRLYPAYHDHSPWFHGAELQDHLKNPPPASRAPFPWAPLHSAAFRPKQCTLTLSRGRFIEPFHYFIERPYPIFQSGSERFAPNRYEWKLAFNDVSPYPPREGVGGAYGQWLIAAESGLPSLLEEEGACTRDH